MQKKRRSERNRKYKVQRREGNVKHKSTESVRVSCSVPSHRMGSMKHLLSSSARSGVHSQREDDETARLPLRPLLFVFATGGDSAEMITTEREQRTHTTQPKAKHSKIAQAHIAFFINIIVITLTLIWFGAAQTAPITSKGLDGRAQAESTSISPSTFREK